MVFSRFFSTKIHFFIPVQLLLTFLLVSLAACNGSGGGGGGGGGGTVGVVAGGAGGVALGGSGADGPIANGDIVFNNSDRGACAGPIETDSGADYSVTLPADCVWPLGLTLTGGTDLVTNQTNYTTMYSFALDGEAHTNISPLTTLIYWAAVAGTSQGTIKAAVDANIIDRTIGFVMDNFGFGIDAADQNFNPLTDAIDDAHSDSFVKANESLIETARRTARVWKGTANSVEADVEEVLELMGKDASDGVLNGLQVGGVATDAEGQKVASIWQLKASTVMVESMTNTLQVSLTDSQGGGTLAGDVMQKIADASNAMKATPLAAAAARAEITGIKVSRKFVTQARAATKTARQLSNNTATYDLLMGDLDAMKASLDASNNVPVAVNLASGVTGGDLSTAEATVNTAANAATFSGAFQAALEYANESTPVINTARTVTVTWDGNSYSVGGPQIGFRLYTVLANDQKDALVCSTTNPQATSLSCPITISNASAVLRLLLAVYDANNIEYDSTIYENDLPTAKFFLANTTNLSTQSCTDLTANGAHLIFDADGDAGRTEDYKSVPGQRGAITDYAWDFGDSDSNNTGSSAEPNHAFYSSNTFRVELTVTDANGIFSMKSQAYLNRSISCL